MIHIRTLIRQALIAALMGQTNAGLRVFNSKVTPTAAQDLPCLNVFTTRDLWIEDVSETPRQQRRRCTVEIHAEVHALPGEFQDALDALCLQIENRLGFYPPGLMDLIEYSVLKDTEIMYSRDGDLPVATAAMSYEIQYIRPEPEPIDGDITDLTGIDVDWDMADPTKNGRRGPDGQIDKRDRYNLGN